MFVLMTSTSFCCDLSAFVSSRCVLLLIHQIFLVNTERTLTGTAIVYLRRVTQELEPQTRNILSSCFHSFVIENKVGRCSVLEKRQSFLHVSWLACVPDNFVS